MKTDYKEINSRQLEKYWGDRAALILPKAEDINPEDDNRGYSGLVIGSVDFNKDGDICLKETKWRQKLELMTGDHIRLHTMHGYLDRTFVEVSD